MSKQIISDDEEKQEVRLVALLQHAIAMNNQAVVDHHDHSFPREGVVSPCSTTAFLHCSSTFDRQLDSLKQGLTAFHALLVEQREEGSNIFSKENASTDTTSLKGHEVSISFGTAWAHNLASQLEGETGTRTTGFYDSALMTSSGSSPLYYTQTVTMIGVDYYLFSQPVVFGDNNVMTTSLVDRNPSPSSIMVDPHNSSSPPSCWNACSLPLSWRSGTRSICVLVGCTIFNIALLNHKGGLLVLEQQCVTDNASSKFCRRQHGLTMLKKSLKLYKSAQVLLQRRLDELEPLCRGRQNSMLPHDPSHRDPTRMDERVLLSSSMQEEEEMVMLTILLIAMLNNMAQIHFFLEDLHQSQFCLQMLLILIGDHTTGRGTSSRSWWCRHHNRIAIDLLNQALLNVLQLLLQPPLPRPAAAA